MHALSNQVNFGNNPMDYDNHYADRHGVYARLRCRPYRAVNSRKLKMANNRLNSSSLQQSVKVSICWLGRPLREVYVRIRSQCGWSCSTSSRSTAEAANNQPMLGQAATSLHRCSRLPRCKPTRTLMSDSTRTNTFIKSRREVKVNSFGIENFFAHRFRPLRGCATQRQQSALYVRRQAH